MPMRKVLLRTTALGNNGASFVNQTARKLHVRRTVMTSSTNAAVAIGDAAIGSLDETPVAQAQVNDSRSHIDMVSYGVGGGTGAVSAQGGRSVLPFNRDDLIIDVDEVLFLNTIDLSGAPAVNWTVNIWYQD